jgi:hypothetical protein
MLHRESGLELRVTYLHTKQTANSPSLNGITHQSYDLIYAGMNWPINPEHRLRYTANWRLQSAHCYSPSSEQGDCNFQTNMQVNAQTFEWNYQHDAKNQIALAYSIFLVSMSEDIFNNTYTESDHYDPAITIQTRLASVSWRHEINSNWFIILQYLHSEAQTYAAFRPGPGTFPSQGDAYGLRLSYHY